METASQVLHRLTSYETGRDWDNDWSVPVRDPRVLEDLEVNRLDRFPWFFKHYPQALLSRGLPRELPATTRAAVGVLAGTADAPQTDLDLAQVSRLLHLSAGVARTMQWRGGTFLFRASGSAGGRFPLELYLIAPEGSPLPAGVHWYHPRDHALVQVGPAPRGGAPALIVTGIPWRTGWRYRERGYRHMYWDAGTMLAQLLAAADSAGLTARLYTQFPDAVVAALVGADRVHELPVAIVSLGDQDPALEPAGPAAVGSVDAAPLEFPLVTMAQRAGECTRLGVAWDRAAPAEVPDTDSATVEHVILARGSARRMTPRSVPRSLLQTCLAVAARGLRPEHWIAVQDVEGIAPGLYRWPGLAAPVRAGQLREEMFGVCMDQGLARDAAFVVMTTADMSQLGDSAYREMLLAAGVSAGRLHLAAYALGAGASGMTFVDGQLPHLLGESVSGLLFTCIGTVDYESKPGGPPGAPTIVRPVRPR